jgi:hypothetical protein
MVFIRRVEDFVCDNCGTKNRGNGYTNHCSSCLYSKHVDIEPGDRLATCLGLMVPVRVELRSGSLSLVHRCQTCSVERRCRTSPRDDMTQIHAVSARQLPPIAPPAPRPRRRRGR